MKIEEKFVETKFGKIAYLEAGKGEKTIIYFHGWFGSPWLIYNLFDRFGFSYRIVAPFFPGHGKSFLINKTFNYANLVETMEDFTAKTAGKKIIRMGFSAGGTIAWDLAAKNQKNTEALVIIDAYSFKTGNSQLFSRAMAMFLDKIRGGIHITWDSHKKRGANLKNMRQLIRVSKDVFSTNKITNNTFPILVLWGRDDKFASWKSFENLLTNAKYEFKEFNGGHLWYHAYMKDCLDMVSNFLNKYHLIGNF